MIKLELSEQEAILTRDALTEAKISLRTIRIPGKDDKVLTIEVKIIREKLGWPEIGL